MSGQWCLTTRQHRGSHSFVQKTSRQSKHSSGSSIVHELNRYLRRLEVYHNRVNHPDYGKRKRGNPPDVLDAVAKLYGSKACIKCLRIDNTHLHHLNGNWKDYNISNLAFYCKLCHLNAHHGSWKNKPQHKDTHMSTRTNWSGPAAATLVSMVTAHPSGKVLPACKDIAKQSNTLFGRRLSVSALENAFYSIRRRNGGTVPTSASVTTNSMTAAEAIEFYRFVKKLGITIN